MNQVFLDTVGLLAVWDDSDQWHSAAGAADQFLRKSGRQFVTTDFVLAECGNAAARRVYRQRVGAIRWALIANQSVIMPTVEELSVALTEFDNGIAMNAGIVDQISFRVV